MTRPADLPDYQSPPVSEVVVGVQFERPAITGAHIGAYWLGIKDRFPKVSEQVTLDPRIENFGDPSPPVLAGFAIARPESRYWFTTSDEVELLQLQADRCLFNWRAVKDGPRYPHFEFIQRRFWQELEEWREFVSQRSVILRANQWEITYVNQIESSDRSAQLDRAFSFFGNELNDGIGGFPESAHFTCQRVLMNNDQPWARGFVVVRLATSHHGEPRMHLELTVRGPGLEVGYIKEMQLKAREWIVRTFDALTSEEMHNKWGKQQ
jgi:uncharacterized protein (TIGR04255 family)